MLAPFPLYRRRYKSNRSRQPQQPAALAPPPLPPSRIPLPLSADAAAVAAPEQQHHVQQPAPSREAVSRAARPPLSPPLPATLVPPPAPARPPPANLVPPPVPANLVPPPVPTSLLPPPAAAQPPSQAQRQAQQVLEQRQREPSTYAGWRLCWTTDADDHMGTPVTGITYLPSVDVRVGVGMGAGVGCGGVGAGACSKCARTLVRCWLGGSGERALGPHYYNYCMCITGWALDQGLAASQPGACLPTCDAPRMQGLPGGGCHAGWAISASRQVINLWECSRSGGRGEAAMMLMHSQVCAAVVVRGHMCVLRAEHGPRFVLVCVKAQGGRRARRVL